MNTCACHLISQGVCDRLPIQRRVLHSSTRCFFPLSRLQVNYQVLDLVERSSAC